MATILLAEDNEAVRLLTQAKLRHQFTVVTAANGRETLDILNRQHVDLIVADVMMPVMDGYQLVRTLRAEGNEIPVLFLTALQSMDSKREGFSSGIDDYLTKPVDYEELIWRIQALLRRAHIASEQQILVGNTRLDSASYTVTCRGQTLELPKKEFDLLYKLLSIRGKSLLAVAAGRCVGVCIRERGGHGQDPYQPSAEPAEGRGRLSDHHHQGTGI